MVNHIESNMLKRMGNTYRTDEPCSRFHGAEASVPNLQSQDLSTRGYTIALRLFWKVTGCNACHMCPMSP